MSAGATVWHGLVVLLYCRHTIQIAVGGVEGDREQNLVELGIV